jgi:hypothetical protein
MGLFSMRRAGGYGFGYGFGRGGSIISLSIISL